MILSKQFFGYTQMDSLKDVLDSLKTDLKSYEEQLATIELLLQSDVIEASQHNQLGDVRASLEEAILLCKSSMLDIRKTQLIERLKPQTQQRQQNSSQAAPTSVLTQEPPARQQQQQQQQQSSSTLQTLQSQSASAKYSAGDKVYAVVMTDNGKGMWLSATILSVKHNQSYLIAYLQPLKERMRICDDFKRGVACEQERLCKFSHGVQVAESSLRSESSVIIPPLCVGDECLALFEADGYLHSLLPAELTHLYTHIRI